MWVLLGAVVVLCVVSGMGSYLRVGGEAGLRRRIAAASDAPADPGWTRWLPRRAVTMTLGTALLYVGLIAIIVAAPVLSLVGHWLVIALSVAVVAFVLAVLISPPGTARVLSAIGDAARALRR